ncbi:MAG: J domain-containing protein [Steroidobacter sp.]
MSGKKSLQISSRASDARLTLDQERFNFLIGQIAKARKALAEWEANALKFRQDHAQRLQPLRATLTAVCRESVFALDRLVDQPGWSRLERAALREMLCGTAEALLEANGGDVELKALFDKHSRIDFDSAKREELQRLKAQAEAFTGFDLGDDGIRTEEDLVQRMYEEMSAREAAADARQSAKAERQRQSAAQKRSEANAQLARQSLREIYRKLASAVHPDREPDPERRQEKNALMQKINQAYAANDLLTLFETQMQIEQIDASHIGAISAQRLKQYNKLLAEQLANLRETMRGMEAAFCMDHGLQPGGGLNPHKLGQLIQRQARRVRAEIEQQQQFLRVLADRAAMKRWLKQQRRSAREDDYFDDESF